MTADTPIGVSMGDPAGIGPEIILKAWSELRHGRSVFVCLGDADVFAATARTLGLAVPAIIEDPSETEPHFTNALPVLPVQQCAPEPVQPGKADSANATGILEAIETGVSLCLEGRLRGLVTAPISKSVLYDAGFTFPGHTEFLAALTESQPVNGPRGPAMMLSGGGLRVVLTSIHEPLKSAIAGLDAGRIATIARLTHHALKQDFAIAEPRLALAGLNPHAGENGALGREEMEIINPVAARLRSEGIDITDALPPDTMFHAEARAGYDAAICLYHDQGLIPVKTLDFHGGVNITLGLPIVRTSPDHGTAFDIAGRVIARPDSLIAAIHQAHVIAENRA